ncbi:MAG TPA: hypothetical protein VN836_06500, partial [Verrucomicrobiae bacterium]|nr:hypothetical protein [Verrucomicrobiae bacterium]
MTEPANPERETPAAAASPAVPPVVPDHELIRLIGGGGSGEVWLGRNVLGTYRAVKIVREKSSGHKH